MRSFFRPVGFDATAEVVDAIGAEFEVEPEAVDAPTGGPDAPIDVTSTLVITTDEGENGVRYA